MPPEMMIPMIVIILLSVALHEFGHAKSADAAGDPTPRMMGRVTLNPLAHLDPLGTIMIIVTSLTGFGIGWGKPVLVDPTRMENPRWDGFMSVVWGPLTNVLIAVFCSLIYRGATMLGLPEVATYAGLAVFVNLGLAFFNLIPLGPLDGHWLVAYLLPPELGARFVRFSQVYGTFLLLALIIGGDILTAQGGTDPLTLVIWTPVAFLASRLLGIPVPV